MTADRLTYLQDTYQHDPAWNTPIDPIAGPLPAREGQALWLSGRAPDTLRAFPDYLHDAPAHYARAYAYHKEALMDKALAEVDAMLELPDDPYALELKGQVLLESGQPQDAIAPLRRATMLTGNNPLIATTFGHALLATEDKANLPRPSACSRRRWPGTAKIRLHGISWAWSTRPKGIPPRSPGQRRTAIDADAVARGSAQRAGSRGWAAQGLGRLAARAGHRHVGAGHDGTAKEEEIDTMTAVPERRSFLILLGLVAAVAAAGLVGRGQPPRAGDRQFRARRADAGNWPRPWPTPGSTAQRKALEALVRQTLLDHPEILSDAAGPGSARKRQPPRPLRGALETPFPGAVLGNPQGRVTLVEFTDFACTYCRGSVADVEALVAANPDLKVVVRELPIISAQSVPAARMGLAAAAQGKYAAFHLAMFGGERPSPESIAAAAGKAGLDIPPRGPSPPGPRRCRELQRNLDLARQLGVSGTPAWVAGDQLLSGAVGRDRLQQAIDRRRGQGRVTMPRQPCWCWPCSDGLCPDSADAAWPKPTLQPADDVQRGRHHRAIGRLDAGPRQRAVLRARGPGVGVMLQDARTFDDPALARQVYGLSGDIGVAAMAADGPAAGLACRSTPRSRRSVIWRGEPAGAAPRQVGPPVCRAGRAGTDRGARWPRDPDAGWRAAAGRWRASRCAACAS
jgi:protein-disulfide isomerase